MMEYADVGIGPDGYELPNVVADVHPTRVGLREFDGASYNT